MAARVELSYPNDFLEVELSYPNDLLENLHSLWQKQQFCDVEISSADGSIVKAHRVILSAGSEYFKDMFTGGLAEETTQSFSIEMKFMKSNILIRIIRFMYTGNIEITTENAQELIVAANILKVHHAVCVCAAFLTSELQSSNVLRLYRLAVAHNLVPLLDSSRDFIITNFSNVILEKEFLDTPRNIIQELLLEKKRQSLEENYKKEQFHHCPTFSYFNFNYGNEYLKSGNLFPFFSAYDIVIAGQGKALIKTDIQVELPEDCYGRVAPRSGLSWKNHIDVGAGVIDRDYRGNVGVVLFNHAKTDFEVKKGDRVAQLICEKIVYPDIEEVEEFVDTERGADGFGSTGMK
ncbi:kelch-like protein 3 [Homarus americanus]|uniref:kelch-like protein 3 n=1 Tax=Homarus americanus TaxID=6706 RepID=UPI001C49680D|nr:kelch-like protein 3 [Homarus americanus]